MAPRRVRTGCLKCRTRRRKCDEGKPRCQRCIAGGFECVYGTRLSFLAKNSFTLDTTPSNDTPAASSYEAIQVSQSSSDNGLQSQPRHDHHSQEPPQNTLVGDNEQPVSQNNSHHDERSQPEELGAMTAVSPFAQHSVASPTNTFASRTDTSSQNGRYQIALDALISLGTEESDPIAETESFPGGKSSSRGKVDPCLSGLPEERVLQLLQYYRYEIAPWLDICDLGQGFGIYVSYLAGYSTSLLRALLSLSATLQNKDCRLRSILDPPDLTGSSSMAPDTNSLAAEVEALCRVLRIIGRSVTAPLFGREPGDSVDLYERISAPSAPMQDLLALHLLLRVDLATAMIEEKVMPIPNDDITRPHTIWHKTQLARDFYQCSIEPLLICIRVLSFCFGSNDNNESVGSPGNMVAVWMGLFEELSTWYSQRRQEFQSVIELDGSDDGIPVVLFTSGAATMANQLFHSAMMLLLQHKPRTAQLPSWQRASTVSFLWHARYTCGIALHNDLREFWDPSMVASLFMAAKRMSHETQHQAILQGFENIGRVTGWNVSEFQTILHDSWS
ncbi:hypothetical protein F5Y15DRAFT_429265 [Xylariaceae sp. FL0016]|nr:hypothetical protein F5Y15DRAFT_429265 [Xylariaceae sp. FL0016]